MERRQLIGRSREVEAIQLMLRRALTGSVSPLWIQGRPGLGASTLLAAAIRDADDAGFRVLLAAAHEFELHWPFALMAELLDLRADERDPHVADLQSQLVRRIEHGPGAINEPAFAKQIVDALLGMGNKPTLIAVDDIHHGDDESIAVLNRAARRARDRPLAIICTCAEGSRRSRVNGFNQTLQSLGGSLLRLEPFDGRQVSDLVNFTLGLRPTDSMATWLEGAAGYPLWILEALEALQTANGLVAVDGKVDLVDPSLPEEFAGFVATRLGGLSEPAARVVEDLSFLTSAPTSIVQIASGDDASQIAAGLQEAAHAALIDEKQGWWVFIHPFVREAVYETFSLPRRLERHLAMARRLHASAASSSLVSDQLLAASRILGSDVAQELYSTAADIREAAPLVALSLLERAEEVARSQLRFRLEVLRAICETALLAGMGQEASLAAHTILDLPGASDMHGIARVLLGRALLLERRWDGAVEAFRAAGAGSGLSMNERAELLILESVARVWGFDLDGSEACLRDLALIDVPETTNAMWATAARASLLYLRGDVSGAARLAEDGLKLTGEPGAEVARVRWLFCGMVSYADRHDESARILAAGRPYTNSDAPGALASFAYFSALNAFVLGEWDAIHPRLEGVLDASLTDHPDWVTPDIQALQALVALHKDEVDLAASLCARAKLNTEWRGDPYSGLGFLTVELQLPNAPVNDTLDDIEDVLSKARAHGIQNVHWHLALPVVRAALSAERVELAREMLEIAQAVADINRLASASAVAEIARALIDNDPHGARRASEIVKESPRVLLRGEVTEAAGSILVHGPDRRGAVSLLTDALRIYEKLDATRDIARVSAALRSLGVTRQYLSKKDAPRSGWESLTPAEWRVVELAAEGHTTPAIAERLFVSPRTVQTHLRAVFRKLQVSTRTELAALVNRRSTKEEIRQSSAE